MNNFCIDCGKEICLCSTRCTQCANRILNAMPRSDKQIEACRENGRKNAKKMNTHPNTIAVRLENSRKNAPKLNSHPNTIAARSENGRKMNEWNAKHGNWISNPEALFYITVLSKNFFLKDIKPQFHIKEINHRVDFAVPSQKLLFEVDGDYYHGHSGYEEMDKEKIKRDAEVDKWAKDNGWTIFRYNDEKMRKLGIIK